jgi:hypothetical protein
MPGTFLGWVAAKTAVIMRNCVVGLALFGYSVLSIASLIGCGFDVFAYMHVGRSDSLTLAAVFATTSLFILIPVFASALPMANSAPRWQASIMTATSMRRFWQPKALHQSGFGSRRSRHSLAALFFRWALLPLATSLHALSLSRADLLRTLC